jgi:putative sigma-54 modulation protein
MDIIIQSQGFKASGHLEDLLREKLEKIGHHANKIMRADVNLYLGATNEIKNNYCDIRLEVPGNDHFAKKNSTSFEHAIVECVDALQHMIEKSKEKETSYR